MSYCTAQADPMFQPAMRLIAAITNANPMAITTTFDHLYQTGTIVRLVIPEACGMQEANGLYGPITVTGVTTFTLPFSSISFAPFSIPGAPDPHDFTCAQILPVGEINSMFSAATQNVRN